MKIVQIEDFFHPDAGYQVNIISKYFVKEGHDVTIITSELEKIPDYLKNFFGTDDIELRDQEYSKKYGVKIIRLPLKSYISGRSVYNKEIFKVIHRESPDIVYLHGNDTLFSMQYLLRYKKMGYPVVMDSHMLEMASTNRFNKLFRKIYRLIFAPIIIKNNIYVIRTQDDPYVEKHLGIPLNQAPWISVGSDTLLFHPDIDAKDKFREEFSIANDACVILYAGKLDESKGGLLLAEAIKEKFPVNREVVFAIVGNAVGEYGNRINAIFEQSENRVLRFPTQTYAELAKYYQSADIVLFPRQCSLSFYDVQACGLPVIFENNSVNESRAVFGNAVTFKSGEVKSFREVICKLVNMDNQEFETMKNNSIDFIQKNYDYADLAKKYLEIIKESVSNYK